VASSKERKSDCLKSFFPCGHDSGWVKEHGRLTRWRIQRKCVSPEEAGLCGCRQFVAVWRDRHHLRGGRVHKKAQEYSYYVSSTAPRDYDEAALLDAMRGHWGAVENGSHHRRDVSMGEDASGISKRPQAHMMASLRNLTLGLFERQKGTSATSLPSWRRKMTTSNAIRMLTSKK